MTYFAACRVQKHYFTILDFSIFSNSLAVIQLKYVIRLPEENVKNRQTAELPFLESKDE